MFKINILGLSSTVSKYEERFINNLFYTDIQMKNKLRPQKLISAGLVLPSGGWFSVTQRTFLSPLLILSLTSLAFWMAFKTSTVSSSFSVVTLPSRQTWGHKVKEDKETHAHTLFLVIDVAETVAVAVVVLILTVIILILIIMFICIAPFLTRLQGAWTIK